MRILFWALAIVTATVVAVIATTWHFYTGSLAELKLTSGVEIVRRERSYGDCYRNWNAVATVYTIKRPQYELRIAHGMRYWPELFLYAIATDGAELTLSGDVIQEAPYPNGGDMRRLREARGTKLTYEISTRLEDVPDRTVQVEVHDRSGAVVGHEKLQYRIVPIDCMEVDSI